MFAALPDSSNSLLELSAWNAGSNNKVGVTSAGARTNIDRASRKCNCRRMATLPFITRRRRPTRPRRSAAAGAMRGSPEIHCNDRVARAAKIMLNSNGPQEGPAQPVMFVPVCNVGHVMLVNMRGYETRGRRLACALKCTVPIQIRRAGNKTVHAATLPRETDRRGGRA